LSRPSIVLGLLRFEGGQLRDRFGKLILGPIGIILGQPVLLMSLLGSGREMTFLVTSGLRFSYQIGISMLLEFFGQRF
jgi:hypothetical protein